MKCMFCGEQDVSKLAISIKAVEGRIIYDREACLDCLWKSGFAIKALGEDGRELPESVEEGIFTQSEFHKLLERFNSIGEGRFI